MKRSFIRSVSLAVVSTLALFRIVFSYIDPNTGGLIFQLLAVILASLTGIFLMFYRHVQIFMSRVKRLFRGESQPLPEKPSTTEPSDGE